MGFQEGEFLFIITWGLMFAILEGKDKEPALSYELEDLLS